MDLTPEPHSSPRPGGLATAALIIMAAFVLSRVLGLAREMVIGNLFGTTRELDAYRAAFLLPDIIFQLIAGGALGSAFIPTFTGYIAKGREDEAWRLASGVFNLALASLTAAALAVAALADGLVPLVVPGFEPQAQHLTAQLVRIMLFSPVLAGLSGIVMGILNSYQHFTLPALAPVIYNLSIIGGAFALAPRWGVKGLAVSVAVGAGLHLLIQVPELLRRRLRYRPTFALDHPGVREVGRLMLPRVVGLAAVQVNFLVNNILASGLSAGRLSALTYAWQLTTLPWGIFAMAISTAVFPTLAAQVARDEKDELGRTLSISLRTILYLTIPAGIGLLVLREPIIALLFQRGEFTPESTQLTAWALLFYAPGLFALAATEIITRAFYALHDTRTPVTVAVITVATNILLSIILVRMLSQGGLALAATIANTGETVALVLLIRRRLAGIDEHGLARSVARSLAASLAMGLFLWWLSSTASIHLYLARFSGLFVFVTVAIALGGGLYLLLTLLLGSEEIRRIGALRKAGSLK
ncbi:MAG: murein biosynthesis integral membrane protein MurJ [Chloroflexota bacterium]